MARTVRKTVIHLLPVAMIGMVTVVGVAGCGHPDPNGHLRPAPGSTTVPASQRLGPARPSLADPDDGTRTSEGARTAAISFVTNGQALLEMDSAAVELTVRAEAATGTADVQVRDVSARIASVHTVLASGTGPIHYRQAALATRIDAFSPERARVAVWHVGVLSRAGIAPPQAGWATSVVDLVWEASGWKLASERVTPGPTPIPDHSAAPVTAAEIDAALDGFRPAGS
jgi:hypothetical protein